MSDLPIKYPRSTLHSLASLIVPPESTDENIIELNITIEDQDIKVRELSAYLSLVDRIYGRVTQAGLRSYSLTRYMQLELSEIRKGSVELIIAEALSHFKDATPLVIVWLFLKYVPGGIKTLSEATKNFADSFKSIEEGRMVRENRKQLKEKIKKDEHLQSLDDKQINEVITLLANLEVSERRKLPAARRFAWKYIKSVKLEVRKKKD